MKKLITWALCGSLLVASSPQARAPEAKKSTTVVECLVAGMVIAIGAVCIYGIWKCCKVLDKLDPPATNAPPPPPPTNSIPTNSIPTNALPPLTIASWSPNLTVQSCDSVAAAWRDKLHLQLLNLGDTAVLTGDNGLCLTSQVVNGVAMFYLQTEPDQTPIGFYRLLSQP